MNLEIIDRGETSGPHPVPLVFVHGAQHAAWCWDDHFLGYFAENGYRAIALSLRGHGGSNSKPVGECSIADFVDDVRTIGDRLPTPPVVIGHSMGGYVVQQYLQCHSAAAAILMASPPPSGIAGAMRRSSALLRSMTEAHPQQQVELAQYLRALFFHPETPDDIVDACLCRLSTEPAVRALQEMTVAIAPPQHRPGTPVMVMGGADDPSVTSSDLRATARAYGSSARVIADMSHNMMLEPGWQEAADSMHVWLCERGL